MYIIRYSKSKFESQYNLLQGSPVKDNHWSLAGFLHSKYSRVSI